jgi:1,5-anhydro-D-fructose reductase (1,5-anhydro-D-mannitol-forming)
MSPDRPAVGWAFVGASHWASSYLIPAVKGTGSRAIGVFSSSPERGAQFAQENGLERSYSGLEELLADPEVDAVYVSTTNDLHAEQSVAAARAGKHVLSEKPLALSIADAKRVVDECRAAGVVLATNHHLRAAPTIVAMRELIDEGAIGDVVAGRVFHAFPLAEVFQTWRLKRPEAGGGAVLDLTVHDADTIRFLLADEIVEVTALTANQGLASERLEDSVMGVMRMRGGQLVSFHDSFVVPHAGLGLEVHGSSGSLIGRGVLAPDPVGQVFLKHGDELRKVEIDERPPIYEVAVRRFNAAVRSEGEPLASGDDGVASLAVALAAAESARTGSPVALSTEAAP